MPPRGSRTLSLEHQALRQEGLIFRQIEIVQDSIADLVENLSETCSGCRLTIRKIYCDQLEAMQTPTCELRRCCVYSQYLNDLPMDLWWLIAEYANHHQEIFKITDDERCRSKIYSWCWCQHAQCLLTLNNQTHVTHIKQQPQEQINQILQDHIHDPEALAFWRQKLQELADWHQDAQWPGMLDIFSR